MNLLPIGDGSTYIDLSKARGEFDLQGVKYYLSEDGVWVRKETCNPKGQAVPEREAFKAFMTAGLFPEAKEHFQRLFRHGSKVRVARTIPGMGSDANRRILFRLAAGVLGLALVAYVAFIAAGKIPTSQRASIADIAVIVLVLILISVLIRPELLSNIQEFGMVGVLTVKLQQKLNDLQSTQEDQTRTLDDLRFTTNLLLTQLERTRLEDLASGQDHIYERTENLQDAMRRLRGLGLIETKYDISTMLPKFNLKDFAELTDLGTEYLKRYHSLNG
jgi:hypothetical protein